MKANYNKTKETSTSEVSLGNIYEMNQQLMLNEPDLTKEELKSKEKELYDWVEKNHESGYFMMLCHDKRDYTLFNLKATHYAPSYKYNTFAFDVIDCLKNRGTIRAIALQEDNVFELWIFDYETENCYAYYLFPYGEAVLEY